MIGREKVRLKTIVSGFFDGPHATPKESDNGAVFLGIRNVTEDGRLDLTDIRYIADEDMPKWTKRVTPQEGDIVFSYEATLHRYAMIPKGFKGCLGRRMALIRINEAVANKRFILHYFLSPLWRKEVEKNIMTGATVDRIPLTNVPDFELHLPPLPIQKRIAEILSAYDDLRENNGKRIKLLEELAQRTYEEWFVRFRVNGEQLPIDESTGLPEGWVWVELKDFGEVVTGKTPPTEIDTYFGGNVPFVKTPDMFGAPYVLQTTQYLSEEGAKLQVKKYIPKNSLMVSCIGSAGVYALASERSQTNQQINTIVFYQEYYTFYCYCYAKSLKPILEALGSNGATMTNVNKGKFEKIKIAKPAKEVLGRFHEFAKPLFDSILNLMKQNQHLKESRDILLPRLMNGTINVTPQ